MTTRQFARRYSPRFSLGARKNTKVKRRLRLETLEDRSVPTAYSWTAAVSGNFNDPSKWTPNGIPGAGDDATIGQTGITVTSPATTTVQSLTNAATLAVSSGTSFTVTNGGSDTGTIDVASGATFDLAGGTLGWTAGTISGAGIFQIENPASLALSAANAKTLDTTTLNNLGTVSFAGTGDLQTGNNALIANAGAFAITTDAADITNNFGLRAVFTNSGTITKSSANGLESSIGTTFNNAGGTITVNSGQLTLTDGTSSGGIYNVNDVNAILDLTGGGTQSYTGTFSGSGIGTVRLGSGIINVTLTNAAFNFPTGLFQWTGGTIQGLAGSSLTNDGTMNLSGSGNMSLSTVALTNNGTINLTGPGNFNTGTTTITNAGTIDLQSDANIVWGFGSAPLLVNDGTVKKSAGADSVIDVMTNNDAGAIISSQAGILDISRDGVGAGTFDAVGAAKIQFSDNYTLNAGAAFTGSGFAVLATNNTLTLNAAISAPNFRWENGGFFGSSGSLTVNGTLDMATGGNKFINNTTVVNAGTGTWSGTGSLNFGNGGAFTNSGTLTIQNDAPILLSFGTAGTSFNNSGTLIKTSAFSSGTTLVQNMIFGNTGTIQVNSGVLDFLTNSFGATSSGPIIVAPGATLQFDAGTTNLNAGTTISGTGNVVVGSGTAVFNTPVTIANLVINGNAGVTAGAGPLTVTNSLNWTAGGIAGTTNVLPGATLTLSGGLNKNLSAATLTNAGAATINGTGNLDLGNGAAFINSGSFSFLSDASVRYEFGNPGNTFINSGTVTKTSSQTSGTSQFFNLTFMNSGTVNISSGILQASDGTYSGSFNINANAKLSLIAVGSGSHTFNAGAQFTGDGIVEVASNGTIVVNAPVTIPHLIQNTGVLTGSSNLIVSSDFTWLTGVIGGPNAPFVLTIAPGATMAANGVGNKFIDTSTLRNEGSMVFGGTANIQFGNAAILRNLGSLDIQSDVGFNWGFGAQAGNRIVNSGSLTKSAGVGTTTISNFVELDNTGTVQVNSGTLSVAGIVTQLSAGTLSTGTWKVGPGATLVLPSNVTTNNASVTLTALVRLWPRSMA